MYRLNLPLIEETFDGSGDGRIAVKRARVEEEREANENGVRVVVEHVRMMERMELGRRLKIRFIICK